jgi:hypothetical protein
LAALGGLVLVGFSGLLIWFVGVQSGDWEGTNVFFIPLLLLIAAGGIALMLPAFKLIRDGMH